MKRTCEPLVKPATSCAAVTGATGVMVIVPLVVRAGVVQPAVPGAT